MDYQENYKRLKSETTITTLAQDNKRAQKPMLIYEGFIGSKVLIKPYSNQNLGFYLDDELLYERFIQLLNQNTMHSLGVDIALIQTMLDDYFKGGEKEVSAVCKEMIKQNKEIHSIKDYQNRGGQCVHKASLGVNLLLIAGYDVKCIWSNIGSENHAFILINDQGKYYLFDPANHSKVLFPQKGEVKIPTIVSKTESEIKAFLNGQAPIEITDADEEKKNAKQIGNIHIALPRLRYETRKERAFISLKNDEIDRYIATLKAKGLSLEEIKNILLKIQRDIALGNSNPKVDSLKPVYDAIAQEDNLESYFGR